MSSDEKMQDVTQRAVLDDDADWACRSSAWRDQAQYDETKCPKRRQSVRRPLILTGYGVRLRVNHGALLVRDGFTHYPQKAEERRFFPGGKDMPSRIVVVDGSGGLSFDAMAWLAEQGVPLIRVDWRGEVVSALGANAFRAAVQQITWQVDAQKSDRKLAIATSLIRAKVANSIETLSLALPSSPARELALSKLRRDSEVLASLRRVSINILLGIEGRAAFSYFGAWRSLPLRWKGTDRRPVPDDWHRIGPRQSANGGKLGKNRRASHPLNAILNYAYAILESHVRMGVTAEGYDPSIGCLHAPAPDRPAFVFDLMEPLRPKIDRKVLEFVQSHAFHPTDFTIRSDGVCRLNPEMGRCVVTLAEAAIEPKAVASLIATYEALFQPSSRPIDGNPSTHRRRQNLSGGPT